ncbi:uncharacterized protein LOC126841537 [Adelges cooleyi]|uniref:uncharacterized protein LOC126841537 n=1 Tax=Adelges cooleyi TaxID=133065 RepID=UPI0021802487|nr:uncharacterized protein LOC126841537 [Adelges cooleyi]
MYISKKNATNFELRGNMTFLIPFDDSISLNINMAKKGSIGGWIDNAHVYTSTKACSKVKSLFGSAWYACIQGFRYSNPNCPIQPGAYVSSGIDIDKVLNTDFPKRFYYGEYKMTTTFTRSSNGEKLGCGVMILDVLRPWES